MSIWPERACLAISFTFQGLQAESLVLYSWTQNHEGETDWNIFTLPNSGLGGRKCRVPRGRFLGGSSGCNGTICVRGVKQDYDDWGSPDWSGDEMYRAMRKVCLLCCFSLRRSKASKPWNFTVRNIPFSRMVPPRQECPWIRGAYTYRAFPSRTSWGADVQIL